MSKGHKKAYIYLYIRATYKVWRGYKLLLLLLLY